MERLATATKKRAAADEEWKAAIRALSPGHSVRAISVVAGVSPSRVHQILHGK